jgi:6-phosphogluconolactonase
MFMIKLGQRPTVIVLRYFNLQTAKLRSIPNHSISTMRLAFLLSVLLVFQNSFCQNYYLFVGTYTSGKSKGIYVYDFNAATGQAKPVSETESKNPSYLAIAAGGRFVYAVSENGGKPGEVSAFSFDKKAGQLSFINKQESGGADPCYISVNSDRSWAVVANYSSGSLSALPIAGDGSLKPAAQVIVHTGKGANANRQEKPHVHSVFFTPDQQFILSADLGTDKLMIYRFHKNEGMPLSDAADSFVSVLPGSGPRHLAFHPSKPFFYLVSELTGSIDEFSYQGEKIKHIERVATTPSDFKGDIGSADIHITPNGKFLYATNRGDANNIAMYSIDNSSGKLHSIGYQSVLGKHPRNFIIDPGGHFLLVANRDTDNVVVFKINEQTGLLKETGTQIAIPNPVCLKLLAR